MARTAGEEAGREVHPAPPLRPRRRRGPRGTTPALVGVGLVLALVAAGCAGTTAGDGAAEAAAGDTGQVLPESAEGGVEPSPTEPGAADTGALTQEADGELEAADTGDRHSEVGVLVDGFPEALLPVPDDAVILVTSAVPVGDADVQEVSLNLRTQLPVADLVTLYRDALAGAGFTEVAGTTPPGDLAVETVYTRSGGDELVSIGILDAADGRTVSIGGRVRTEG